MNLYNIFEGSNPTPVTNTVGDEKQKQYAKDTAAMAQAELVNKMPRMAPTDRKDPKMGMQEDDPIAGALTGLNGVSATLGTDNDRSPLTVTEQDEFGYPVTEHDPETIDEVAMNPRAFAQAIKTGQEKGVLVGFEFETCIPKRSVEAWKTGTSAAAAPGYNPTDLSWIEGKTVADVIDGLARVGRKNWGDNLNDLFKYKASVKTQTGFKSPWYHYGAWVNEKMAQIRNDANADKLTFEALAAFLKDPEVKAMEVSYMNDRAQREFGDPDQYNGRTFALAVLKAETGIDFGKRVAKALLTPEVARKVRETSRMLYQWTRGPFDNRVNQIGNAGEVYLSRIENQYRPGSNYRQEATPEAIETFKQHFAEFCRETMGTDNLKDLLKTKWAFNGRVNNTTDVLKQKLWYFVTPGAEEPASLQARSYNRGGYSEGAEFLKANLKDLYGNNIVIFTGYHQDTKKLDRWYIEPDGSLRPTNSSDYTAEVVSPPMKAAEAMTALQNWYQRAAELGLYTNNSTGLHINVSIPETLDVLKLAVFAGDQHVLKMFGRENNNYARSVIKSLKGSGSLPTVGSKSFKDAEREMKDLVKRISGDHFATVNFNGKYVSFRHAGGDYLSKRQDIANTVGRFVRAMIIAADPQAFRDEYVGKLVKMMKSPAQNVNDKLPLSDIRNIASKGIPTINLDVAVIPRSADMPTQEDIDEAVNAIKRWAGEDWKTAPSIVPDPSARARLLDSRGFMSSTKQWLERAPENMFLRVTVYPSNRNELEKLADQYTSYGTDRGAAIGLHHGGKRAVGVKYRELVKQDNPTFVKAIQALRGGASKPLPLPGTKNAPVSQRADKFGIWHDNGWLKNGNGRIEGTPDEVQEYMDQWNLTDTSRYELRPITGDTEQDSNEERAYHLVNADGDMIQNYRGTLADTRRVAQSVAQRIGADVSIVDNGTTVDTVSPEYPGNTGYTVVDTDGRTIGQTHETEDDALDAAQELANARNRTYFVNDPDGDRVGGARPEDYSAGDEEDDDEEGDQQHTATGSYRLINNSGDHVADYVGSLEDAMRAAQHYANQTQMIVAVTLNGEGQGYRRPEPQQARSSDEAQQAYYNVVDASGRTIMRSDVLRDAAHYAQRVADTENTSLRILAPDGRLVREIHSQQAHGRSETNEGITSPGGMTTNDSTSPIHGFGENDEEQDYDGEYQAMVQRVGQKAREQEKRQPVDLAALAQRLRQGENEVDEHIVKTGGKYQLRSKHGNKNLGTYDTKAGAEKRERQVQYFKHMGEDEVMESYLYQMKKAGYDIL